MELDMQERAVAMMAVVVVPLPPGVRLIMVLDGGATLDVPFRFLLQADDRTTKVIRGNKAQQCKGEFIAITEFHDEPVSSDFVTESMGSRKSFGALTQAFTSCVTENISYHKLLQRMRRWLRKQGYSQVPQISSERFFKLDEPIVTHGRDTINSHSNSSGLCPLSLRPSVNGERVIDMELAQMEAHVRELRRKKAEEEQATVVAQAQMQPNAASSFAGLPSLGAPPSVPSVPKDGPASEQHGGSGLQRTSQQPGIAGHGASCDTTQPLHVNPGLFDSQQPMNGQNPNHSFASQQSTQSSGSPPPAPSNDNNNDNNNDDLGDNNND